MKKTFFTLIFGLFMLLVSNELSAQTIIKDSIAPDGTRIVQYKPKGVCAVNIEIHTFKKHIKYVHYTRGCDGNQQGIATLVMDMKVKDAINKLEGIKCGNKPTSCPDQLATALKLMQEKKK